MDTVALEVLPFERNQPASCAAVTLLRPMTGVVDAADVRVAERVAALAHEDDERVRLAAALAVRSVRAGSVGLDLDELLDLAELDRTADLSWPVAPPRLRSARWRRRRDPVDEAAPEPQPLRVLFVGPDGRESATPPGGGPRGRDPDRLSVDFP